MALDFPNSPTVGQNYTSSGATWTWDGTGWVATANAIRTINTQDGPDITLVAGSNVTIDSPAADQIRIASTGGGGGGATVTVSATAPVAPAVGNLWWDTVSGNLFIYFNDGTSSQWVIAVNSGPTVLSATPIADCVPLNINSAMMVSQEFGTSVTAVTGIYSVDGFQLYKATAGAANWVQGGPFMGSSANSLQYAVVTPVASLAAGDIPSLQFFIEGLEAARLGWGTASAKSIVLRFGFYSQIAGTFSVCARTYTGAATARSYVRTFTVSAGEVGTRVVRYITIPGDTSNTANWPATATGAIIIDITLGCGSTYATSTLNAWQTGTFVGAAGQTNGVATAVTYVFDDVAVYDATGYATDSGPPFVVPNYSDELRRCQRYFQPQVVTEVVSGGNVAGGYISGSAYFGQPMRIVPTMTRVSSAGDANIGAVSFGTIYVTGARYYASTPASGIAAIGGYAKADARF